MARGAVRLDVTGLMGGDLLMARQSRQKTNRPRKQITSKSVGHANRRWVLIDAPGVCANRNSILSHSLFMTTE
jgi:hypothetical protein